jgi:TRAP-type C4-dicarboxylate transport system substrate-binding protein
VRKALESAAKETQAFVYQTATNDEDALLAKIKAAGVQVNQADKNAFIAASKPIYAEFAREVKGAQALIDRAIALGK